MWAREKAAVLTTSFSRNNLNNDPNAKSMFLFNNKQKTWTKTNTPGIIYSHVYNIYFFTLNTQ